MKMFGGTPSWFDIYKDQGILTSAGTPGTSSRQPGWEPLIGYEGWVSNKVSSLI